MLSQKMQHVLQKSHFFYRKIKAVCRARGPIQQALFVPFFPAMCYSFNEHETENYFLRGVFVYWSDEKPKWEKG